ncbi:1018_t:CDS:2, partial [Dentiscutata erythropus]
MFDKELAVNSRQIIGKISHSVLDTSTTKIITPKVGNYQIQETTTSNFTDPKRYLEKEKDEKKAFDYYKEGVFNVG